MSGLEERSGGTTSRVFVGESYVGVAEAIHRRLGDKLQQSHPSFRVEGPSMTTRPPQTSKQDSPSSNSQGRNLSHIQQSSLALPPLRHSVQFTESQG